MGLEAHPGVIMYDPWVIPEALDFLVRTKNKYPHERRRVAQVRAGGHQQRVREQRVASEGSTHEGEPRRHHDELTDP